MLSAVFCVRGRAPAYIRHRRGLTAGEGRTRAVSSAPDRSSKEERSSPLSSGRGDPEVLNRCLISSSR
jgi:hypothetical protein